MQPDRLKQLADPFRQQLVDLLAAAVPAPWRGPLVPLVDLAGLVVVAAVLATLGRSVIALTRQPTGMWRATGSGLIAGSTIVTGHLFGWILDHPSPQFEGLFSRWDHLTFCALTGLALTKLPATGRKGALAIVSLAFLIAYGGAHAVAVMAIVAGLGFALHRSPLAHQTRALMGAHAALLAAAYCYAWSVHRANLLAGLQLQGLLAFAGLRQISFAVEASKAPRRAIDYVTFMAFYPGMAGMFGGPETYAEFARRNLVRPVAIDHHRALRRIAQGATQGWLSLLIPVSMDTVLACRGPWTAWPTAIAFFVHTVLFLMGGWALIDGVALFYGMQLRANFSGLLTCRNPSELWWAWRGTLTNWLVQHIYAPLGGAQHRARNIVAVFAASFLWHALGAPFLNSHFRLISLGPLALWVAINAAAVLAHAILPTARGRTLWRHPLLGWMAVPFMWGLGAMTPILLHFQGDAFSRFPELTQVLLGLPR